MIVLNNISFSYRRNRPVLTDLSLELQSGTVCGLLGRNGVGKSTMLYLMAGLLRPSTGFVTCNGFKPIDRKVEFLNDIFIVPEEFRLPSISLEDYIKLNSPFYPKFDREIMTRLLKLFDLTADINLGALSMGQKKKAFLSFAMACNTNILLLDEPTNGLDISAKRAFRMAVSSIMDENKTIVISTHQVNDVEQILDHIIITDNNRILLNRSTMDITSRLRFNYTNDPQRAGNAMFSLPVPGGFNIVDLVNDPSEETDVNLESLFEMTQKSPEIMSQVFSIPPKPNN